MKDLMNHVLRDCERQVLFIVSRQRVDRMSVQPRPDDAVVVRSVLHVGWFVVMEGMKIRIRLRQRADAVFIDKV